MTTNETKYVPMEIFDWASGTYVPIGEYRKYDHLNPQPRIRGWGWWGWWCLHCGVHNPDSNSNTCINGCI